TGEGASGGSRARSRGRRAAAGACGRARARDDNRNRETDKPGNRGTNAEDGTAGQTRKGRKADKDRDAIAKGQPREARHKSSTGGQITGARRALTASRTRCTGGSRTSGRSAFLFAVGALDVDRVMGGQRGQAAHRRPERKQRRAKHARRK